MNPVYEAFKLAYQVSPIILTNGIATLIPGGMLPIVAITEGLGFQALVSLASTGALPDQYFANYRPVQGSTLIKNTVAQYPFFTQQIAANAQIQEPLNISMLMYCPAGKSTPFTTKLAIMSALKSLLNVHNSQGGTYSVVTPSCIYTGCLLTQIADVSDGQTNQSQWAYQWDFVQPLLTFPEANGVQNAAMSMLSSGGTFLPNASGELSWSGLAQQAFPSVYNFAGNYF